MKIHEHGHIILEAHMGSDIDVVNSARVSFNEDGQLHFPTCNACIGEERDPQCDCGHARHYRDNPPSALAKKDRGLINFLMKNGHGSPFESVALRFDVKAPIFVFREWHRHRAGHGYNEWSGRYSQIDPEFYVPQRDYIRAQVGKPGAYTFERVEDDDHATHVQDKLSDAQWDSYATYQSMLDAGIAKEVARVVLPVGTYSRMKWYCNLRSAMHFLSLRNSEHAQREIRDYAIAAEGLINQVCPISMAAFVEHGRKSP